MMEEKKLNGIEPLFMFGKLWNNKKSLLLIMIIGLVIGLVISWSIPTTYSTEVRLVPDKSTLENSNFISDVVKSKPFLLGFWTMKVSRQHEDTEILLRDYILNDMKFPWWNTLLNLPSKISEWGGGKKEYLDSINLFYLQPEQMAFVNRMNKNVKLKLDKTNGILSLVVTMQDPLISAVVANKILEDMQEVVTEKKTLKANSDVRVYEKLLRENYTNYTRKRKELFSYIEREEKNGAISNVEQEFLQQELAAAYTPYMSMVEMVDKAKVKVQEETPSFAIIEPVSVPTYASGPQTLLIVLGSVFLFAFCGIIFLLLKEIVK